MADTLQLRLYEQIVLLGLDREKGTFASDFTDFSIAGAVLTELVALERIALDDSRKPKVRMRSAQRIGDPVLDRCLREIQDSSRTRSIEHWVTKLSRLKHLRQQVVDRLVRHRVVRAEERKVLGPFNRTVFPESNAQPEAAIVSQLREAIFGDQPVDADTALLVALADGSSVLKPVADKRELRKRKARIKDLTEGDAVGEAASKAIQAAQAAVIAATTSAITSG